MENKGIHVIDNFYDEGNYAELLSRVNKLPFTFFWGDQHGSHYWNHQVDEESPVKDICKKMWEDFTGNFNRVGNLAQAYINGQTFGLEPGPHYDYGADDGVTVVNYVTDRWELHWGGETFLYDQYAFNDRELKEVELMLLDPLHIDKAVQPRRNRIVIFPAHQLHMVKPLNRFHQGIRFTFMYKMQGITVPEIMAGYKGAKNV